MEHVRFDAIARTLSTPGTRRDTFRALAAAGLGLGVMRLGLESAGAKSKKKVTDRCSQTEECAGTLLCQKANSQHHFPKTEKRCCVKEKGTCNDGIDCCG